MKTSKELPPNIDKILAAFDIKDVIENIVFTYGDTCYNVQSPLPEHLVVHESTHTRQQGDSPDVWWNKYIADPQFRATQEVEAYGNQYAYAKEHIKDRNALHRFLFSIASDLSGKMYGNIYTYGQAESKIRNASLQPKL